MIICKKCGGQTPQGYSYCTICGTILDGMKEQKVIPLPDYNDLIRDRQELESKKSLLDDLRKHGYAPAGFKLMSDSEYNSLLKGQDQLSIILNEGYAPSGKRLVDEIEYANLKALAQKKSHSLRGLAMWGLCLIFACLLGWFLISPNVTNSNAIEGNVISGQLEFPDDLTGCYIVREQEGKDGEGIAAKILQEDGKYSMSIYSSSVTRKYFFTYNKKDGALSSEELGAGKVEYIGHINQLKVSFEGWTLIK